MARDVSLVMFLILGTGFLVMLGVFFALPYILTATAPAQTEFSAPATVQPVVAVSVPEPVPVVSPPVTQVPLVPPLVVNEKPLPIIEVPEEPCKKRIRESEERFKSADLAHEQAIDSVVEAEDSVREAALELEDATRRAENEEFITFLRNQLNLERQVLRDALVERDRSRDALTVARRENNAVLRDCKDFVA